MAQRRQQQRSRLPAPDSSLPSVNDIERANKLKITGRNPRQVRYIKSILTNPITIGLGPAGTGKTYLPAIIAADLLLKGVIDRLIIVRPAVAAGGEEHGFLPGDLKKKLAPWCRPVADKIVKLVGARQFDQWVMEGKVEAVPFTYMRGLEFENALVLLDEAQNTTPLQMKLLTTRLGENTRLIVNGDVSQRDLEAGAPSGLSVFAELADAYDLPAGIIEFQSDDVERSELTRQIVKAWEGFEKEPWRDAA